MMFENELFDTIPNFKFTDFRSDFQRKLAQDVREINKSESVFLLADKTTNIYKVSAELYHKLLFDNVTKDYTPVPESVVREINLEAQSIASNLELENRIEQFGDAEAFVSLKDHKNNS